MRYIWREAERQILMGATPSVQSRLGSRSAVQLMTCLMARNSPETVETISPTPRSSIAVSSTSVRIFVPRRKQLPPFPEPAWDATHSMSERCGSNGRGYRAKDTRHCDHVSACPPIVGRLRLWASWRVCMHIVLQALEVSQRVQINRWALPHYIFSRVTSIVYQLQ